jgi:hypothetical protein
MSMVLDFDEKKFWIALFSIVARREAARESRVGGLRAWATSATGEEALTQDSDSAPPNLIPFQSHRRN